MSKIIDGKKVSQEIKEKLKLEVADFKGKTNLTPGLATVLVGVDPASKVYIRNKIKGCEFVGIESFHHELDEKTSEEDLLDLIEKLNKDQKVNGILVQLPLPDHIDSDRVLEAIDPKKDVDGFHPFNVGSLVVGKACLKPCTPHGVMKLIESIGYDLNGKNAVVVGRSNIVGKPVSLMLLEKNATVTICHSRTKDLPNVVKNADVVIAAVGRAEFIKGDWLKEDAIVLDVGINRLDSGKLVGDVEFELAESKVSAITPVPGGVGPMTIAMLLDNTLAATKLQSNY
jgi:methylenetetrahydrofolate dehydrogenase (NADP+)/methenyltetrahydrofolate cyclohydrolase